jgi:hypothetical protein
MVKYCRNCGLPFEALKVNQLYCNYCRIWLGNSSKKSHTEAAIEEINRKASALGLSYGQRCRGINYKLEVYVHLLTIAK